MATASTSTSNSLITKFRAYHAKHPIIVSYGVLCTVFTFVWGYHLWDIDPKLKYVKKYKRTFTIMRPDDPKVTMIKRGRIGMDY